MREREREREREKDDMEVVGFGVKRKKSEDEERNLSRERSSSSADESTFQSNRIQVSNVKKPLFFYVNLAQVRKHSLSLSLSLSLYSGFNSLQLTLRYVT